MTKYSGDIRSKCVSLFQTFHGTSVDGGVVIIKLESRFQTV